MSRLHLRPVFWSLSLSLLVSLLACELASCDPGDSANAGEDAGVVVAGCTPAGGARPKTAPDGYYVNGNTICTPDGKPHLLHGVDRPSLEWQPGGDHLSEGDFASMASWHANVVRVALNQDFWLSDAPSYYAGYAAQVDEVVRWAEQAGLDVILDLHWSDQGNYAVKPGQQTMADTHSLQFWKEVAARYKGDGRVFFELYNEPHDVPPAVWLSGGDAGFTVVGMQQLHDAIRAAGADNLVLVGGLNWAYDLSHVAAFPVVGSNILYVTHPYNNAAARQPDHWTSSWGYLTSSVPVVVTEFGDASGTCSTDWDKQLIAYADSHHTSWTAWAWFASDCKFPALLKDWNGTTTAEGAVVKEALLRYDDPAAPRPGADAGSDAGGDAAPDAPIADAGGGG